MTSRVSGWDGERFADEDRRTLGLQSAALVTGSIPVSTNLEADTLIRRVEVGHDLLQHRVDGWCAWPVVRFEVCSRLLQWGDDRRGGRLRDLGSRSVAALRDLLRFPSLRLARHLFLCYASNRSDEAEGRSRDIFVDDLFERLESSRRPEEPPACLKVEHADNPLFAARASRAAVHPAIGTAFITLASQLLARIWPSPSISKVAGRIEAALWKDLGVAPMSQAEIAFRLRHFRWSRRLYGTLLDRVRPRTLTLVTAYGNHAAVAAAKARGIRVVELQHGHNPRDHSGYSWTAYARRYRPCMPVPDRILVYGDFWAEELRAFGFWGEAVIATGSAQMQRYRARRAAAPARSPSLAVTTQGVDSDRVTEFLRGFLRLMADRPVTVSIKLHPAQRDTARFARSFAHDPRVRVVGAHEAPSTFELISEASLHASISSTCHYEALALGVPTAILPFTGHELVLDLVQEPGCRLVSSPEELVEFFRDSPSVSVPLRRREYYFADDALAAIQRVLTEA